MIHLSRRRDGRPFPDTLQTDKGASASHNKLCAGVAYSVLVARLWAPSAIAQDLDQLDELLALRHVEQGLCDELDSVPIEERSQPALRLRRLWQLDRVRRRLASLHDRAGRCLLAGISTLRRSGSGSVAWEDRDAVGSAKPGGTLNVGRSRQSKPASSVRPGVACSTRTVQHAKGCEIA